LESYERPDRQSGQIQFVRMFFFLLEDENKTNLSKFANDIRQSDRVKQHIKQLDDMEIGEQYHLLDGNKMTNLGVLWIGTAKQRSRICYPITVQYIVYDDFSPKKR
jgi:ATP-dependent DNA helicase RecG